MKIITYTATYSRNFQLANYGGPEYENIKAEATITVELDESDTPDNVMAEVNRLAKEAVQSQVTPVLDHYRKQVADIRASVPGLEGE